MAARKETQWGIRHEGGQVTVQPTGHGFASRQAAEREAARFDLNCEYCTGDQHEAVSQTVTYGEWRTPGPIPLRLPQREKGTR